MHTSMDTDTCDCLECFYYREDQMKTRIHFDQDARIIGRTIRDHSNLFTADMAEAMISSYCADAMSQNPRFDPVRFRAAVDKIARMPTRQSVYARNDARIGHTCTRDSRGAYCSICDRTMLPYDR